MIDIARAASPAPAAIGRRIAVCVLALIALAYLAACAYMGIYQRSFVYRPVPAWIAPEGQSLPRAAAYEITADDGTILRGWRIPPTRPDALTYIYFHGNAKGLDSRAERFALMTADGSGLVAMSYRGYGGSGGHPSEAALEADAATIYRDVTRGVPAERIVLFGESLGTGVAVNLATQVETRAVILDSPYRSVLARAEAAYPWLPVSWLLVDTFRSDRRIGAVKAPVLILHGTADNLIPLSDSAALMARGGGNIRRILYPGQPHVVPYDKGPDRDVPVFLAAIP